MARESKHQGMRRAGLVAVLGWLAPASALTSSAFADAVMQHDPATCCSASSTS
jgi:hypothetical protein